MSDNCLICGGETGIVWDVDGFRGQWVHLSCANKCIQQSADWAKHEQYNPDYPYPLTIDGSEPLPDLSWGYQGGRERPGSYCSSNPWRIMIVVHFIDGGELVGAVSVSTVEKVIEAVADCHKETQGNVDACIVNPWDSFTEEVKLDLLSAVAKSCFDFPPGGRLWAIGEILRLKRYVNMIPTILAVDAELAITCLSAYQNSI